MTSSARIFSVPLVVALAALLFGAAPAEATISPSPCPGSVCTGSVTVGGQAVNYAYTQHVKGNGTLKVRLNGGTYNTGLLISYTIAGLPTFSGWSTYANPTNGAVVLPTEVVDPAHTAYERKDADGCASCIVDQVMTVTFSGLADGAYSFDVSIFQNGAGGVVLLDLPFYVDAGAPDNNESTPWAAISGMDKPCADLNGGQPIDNDLDYYSNCADTQCVGQIGRAGDGALCQNPESTCTDAFDNDADGLSDCLDSSCNGLVGRTSPLAYCQYANEHDTISGTQACTDNFDNDADGLSDCYDNVSSPSGNPANTCWKQNTGCPATETSCTDGIDNDYDQSYNSGYDAVPTTGKNCQDYDCAGNPACPSNEAKTAGGVDAEAQCFNTVDDDLDTKIDCSDPDCAGVVNPGNPDQMCHEKEFDLVQHYQFCANSFDDDGDVPIDCADTDCKRAFGSCGPCPNREDFRYNSCADGSDNDSDNATQGFDCADPDCAGKLGSLTLGAQCATAESGALCKDGFDNDQDGSADCLDSGCSGAAGPSGETCQPAAETTCNDGKDNDADGSIDCADTQCFGVGSCAVKNWTNAACQIVPEYSGFFAFASGTPTVTARVTTKSHVFGGAPAEVEIRGTATYSSVAVYVGNNTDPAKYFPYASGSCALTGTGAAQMSFTSIDGHQIQIFNQTGQTISNFDVTLSCPTPVTPAATRNYQISVSMLKQPGSVVEYGSAAVSTTLYEHANPTVTEIEPEGDSGGTLTVPYNTSRRFRVVPNDPGAGLDTSGVCRCTLKVSGPETTYASPDGNCITGPLTFQSDMAPITLDAKAQDGAANESGYGANSTFTVNVVPAMTVPLTSRPTGHTSPFLKGLASEPPEQRRLSIDILDVEFRTGTTDGWPVGAPCNIYVRDSSGAIVNGPVGPTATLPGEIIGNLIRCNGSITLPTGLSDGEYGVAVRVADTDGDTGGPTFVGGGTFESNRRALFMCNNVPAAGEPETICSQADFDDDGAPEGLFTTLYSPAPRACDNCVNLTNDQTDANANGIGDACEPSDPFGRCEFDRDIISQCASDAPPTCTGPRCPGPPEVDVGTCQNDPEAAQCIDDSDCGPDRGPCANYTQPPTQKSLPSWGICSADGKICFKDNQCNNSVGACTVGGAACERDIDCGDNGPCVGADTCLNLLFPWLQTSYGNIFSKKKISAAEPPPSGQYNATYCMSARDQVLNFKSQSCDPSTGEVLPDTRFELPKASNTYTTVLGRIDVAGLLAGRYGDVITISPDMTGVTYPLKGKVYVLENADLVVSGAPVTISNGSLTDRGNGTIVVKGGNITFNTDVSYSAASIFRLPALASIGWIALDAESGPNLGLKGNIYIGKDVTQVDGAFFAGGQDGIYTVWPTSDQSELALTVHGLMVGRAFHLGRNYKSSTEGSERFIYDGRAIANPPPGFADVTKSLPLFKDSAP
ncbi:hypothetical protein HY633_01055 [Candidatus Uhrbacteria bacterium]|nr:hypothetical protein [Candidatus Uhrbacteria bacterium]